MPRTQLPARVVEWRGKLHFFFRENGKPKRILCEKLKCFTKEDREEMVRELRKKERLHAYAEIRGEPESDHRKRFADAVQMFLDHSDARRDLADASKQELHKTLDPFRAWLLSKHPSLTTWRLGGQVLSQYLNGQNAGPATVNKHRRNLKSMLRWLDTVRPKLFPEIAHLLPSLKQEYVAPREAVAFSPTRLKAAISTLPEDQQRIFRFIACTGCRLGEAEALTWDDVDLRRGRITFRSTKTKRARILPLTGAPEGEVAPKLLAELKRRKRAGLPPAGGRFDREPWRTRMGDSAVTPQELRRNFTSYAASLGIPASVCAMWQGHGVMVAERHYRQQVLDRKSAKSIEAAMGL